MAIKPKTLILNLLMEAVEPVSSQVIIQVSRLFEVTENSTRVTLARLLADKMLETPSRGHYQLGPAARNLADDLSHWRDMEEKVCPWDGRWIGVFVAHLGRGNRSAFRQRMRILHLAGFAELAQGLLVRPNNLAGGTKTLRKRLEKLGLEPEAKLMVLTDLDKETNQRVMSLWDCEHLSSHYLEACNIMEDWMSRANDMDAQTAAKESYLIGDESLRCIAFDPLLPEEMVDVAARCHYVQTMVRFDQLGKSIWKKLYKNYKTAVGVLN
ncbi:PaaX family transcriptional regulator [Parendozoicomonas sp. Alg238-R29]|uniref:PaaX family transcriptional regulator n=1 Tax=Parendozoicomonas sp. Alg238-R29 TaxID=2993446 RepID=UPI00248DAB9A|nr:PaaX family transcriptional regulator [Parendozoicomonas sp. Alg238-R29]